MTTSLDLDQERARGGHCLQMLELEIRAQLLGGSQLRYVITFLSLSYPISSGTFCDDVQRFASPVPVKAGSHDTEKHGSIGRESSECSHVTLR